MVVLFCIKEVLSHCRVAQQQHQWPFAFTVAGHVCVAKTISMVITTFECCVHLLQGLICLSLLPVRASMQAALMHGQGQLNSNPLELLQVV